MGPRRIFIPLLMACLAIAACSDTTAEPALDLNGTSWRLIDGLDTVVGYQPTIAFDGAQVGGSDGCNGYGGRYDLDGNTLRIDGLGGTDMGCEGPNGEDVLGPAAEFLRLLQTEPAIEFDDDVMRVSAEGGVLVFEPIGDIGLDEIAGEIWVMSEWTSGGETVEASGEPWMVLDLAGVMQGSTGCRSLSGEWILSDTQEIVLTTFGADGSCAEDLTTQDGIVVNILGDGFSAARNGDILITNSAGNESATWLIADALPEAPSVDDQVGFTPDASVVAFVIDDLPLGFAEAYAEPDLASVLVSELGPGERLVAVGAKPLDDGTIVWRQVLTDANANGWVDESILRFEDR